MIIFVTYINKNNEWKWNLLKKVLKKIDKPIEYVSST